MKNYKNRKRFYEWNMIRLVWMFQVLNTTDNLHKYIMYPLFSTCWSALFECFSCTRMWKAWDTVPMRKERRGRSYGACWMTWLTRLMFIMYSTFETLWDIFYSLQLNFDISNTDISNSVDMLKWFVVPTIHFLSILSLISRILGYLKVFKQSHMPI